MADNNSTINQAVASGGSYEVIRKRLEEQNKQLEQKIIGLNQLRESTFGKTVLEVVDRVRVRTENNCTPRDMVRINGQLLFGYNVFIGLKKATQVKDVFALYSLHENEGKFEVKAEPLAGSFLADEVFVKQFLELYSYYKKAELIQLRVVDQKLLAAFQIGEKIGDIRVFRWVIGNNGEVQYIDDRGERDIELPPAYDFEWHKAERDQFVQGRHPHVSIMDEVFVETVGGDLTIKVENNTEDGEGIYQEAVDEPNQSLEDADIYYAKVHALILLKILPYKEQDWRYFVFNTRNNEVLRIDALGHACVQLPNDHGIIFPGGYYLQSGESKVFAEDVDGLLFKRRWNAPNGEDVLYVFYEKLEGKLALYSYNTIRKELQNPIFGHGYSLYDDGKMIIFRAESTEATRIHPMQIWQTPYTSEEYSASQSKDDSELSTIGNAELVQGISELYGISKLISEQQPSVQVYEDLIKNIQRVKDGYYWLENSAVGDFSEQLDLIGETSELVLDEFEKVKSINLQSAKALKEAQHDLQQLLREIKIANWDTPAPFVDGLLQLKRQKGHLLSLREYRYIDLSAIEDLSLQVDDEIEALGKRTIQFLSDEQAMLHYEQVVDEVHQKTAEIKTVKDLKPLLDELDEMSLGLDALSEVINGLEIDDTLQKTAILESVSQVYSRINQTKAHAKLTSKELSATESVAEFGAQLAVLSQSITSGVALAETPDGCDEQLARLMVLLEELEVNFSENEAFLDQILTKREELHETFENKKQSLIDQRQRKAENVQSAATRVLKSIERRSLKFTDSDQLNTYYSSDPMIHKVKELIGQLHDLDDSVKADDTEARLKAIKEQAIRSLRDKQDIFEDGGKNIKLGKHRFSVNTQSLDLTILPRNDALYFHLSGTDFYEPVNNQKLHDYKDFWPQTMSSENDSVYRAEYLAYNIFQDAIQGEAGSSIDQLVSLDEEALVDFVKAYANPRYQEGYEKGIHDHDASKIISQLLQIYQTAPLMMFGPSARALASYFWLHSSVKNQKHYTQRAQTANKIAKTLGDRSMCQDLYVEFKAEMDAFYLQNDLRFNAAQMLLAAEFLLAHIVDDSPTKTFQVSKHAADLVKQLNDHLTAVGEDKAFKNELDALNDDPKQQWQLIGYWLSGMIRKDNEINQDMLRFINEATVLILAKQGKAYDASALDLACQVDDLLGDHSRIKNRTLKFEFDEFMERLSHYHQQLVPEYQEYREMKQTVMHEQRAQMALETFKARPLASFVRNQLINQSYLPIIGDNLAKQMGAAGQNKRSDLMGLLLLISPPGYGKTTLMEYTANRLGLNFMKINCPSLGHDVKSLDPANAPNATAKQELEKLNLALEMGNNVMLYLDDIQHTHAEFLQKFISLCDGTRKIEGVWRGMSKTYDMRGKKFCVIMAGNPYTESGEVFRVPDMLANRADVYNLGDILGGQEDVFAMSYIENSLTSNPVLAPLALREMNDLYLLMDMAKGKEVATSDLSHSYASSEINEIITVLKHLFTVQEVILKVNQAYISSAAMDDRYRQEPPFKLQGSYRNMNKLAEKVVPVMDQHELQQLIDDHYAGEAQLLTTGAEENLLKLKALRGTLNAEDEERWQAIKAEFKIRNALAGDEADGATKIASQIGALKTDMSELTGQWMQQSQASQSQTEQQLSIVSDRLSQAIEKLNLQVNVSNEPLPGLDDAMISLSETLETSFVPIVVAMNKKLNINNEVLEQVTELSQKIKNLSLSKSTRTVNTTESQTVKSKAAKRSAMNKSASKKKAVKKTTKKE
ncbi:DNA repair ATPase [Marinicella sp. S1101]|uniref:DNA repair ATPase n=1 Tax=Marinicella marina TaxID=2996016 RepID=UPI002260FEA3|nr:DNA repair ATPase [Marinicella marina]MCX7553580.1 DNA repair ATPase [Marinicella marina]MDJ1140204.1 DNA repair ATPase [Marinicella marina]